MGGSIWTSGNTSLLWGWLGAGAGCQEVVQSASGKMLETCLGTALAGCSSCPCLSRGVGLWTRQTLEVPPNLSGSVIACADSTGLLRLKSAIGAPSSGSLSIASLDVYGGRHEYSTNVHLSALLVIGTICLWLFKPSYHLEFLNKSWTPLSFSPWFYRLAVWITKRNSV